MSGVKSKLYAIILVVIVLGYIFFFASPFIFHIHRDLMYTQINTTAKLSDTVSITIKKWVYSPNDNTMSAMFIIDNSGLNDIVLNRSVQERHTKKFLNIETGSDIISLKSNVEYPYGNIVVVSITEVPKGFEEIALSLQLSKGSEQASENKIVSFYTNRNMVETVDKLEKLSDREYRIEYLRMQIESKKQQIEELEEKNNELIKDNEKYLKDIKELEEEQEYQTTDEIKATLQRISNYERQIHTNSEAIEKNKYSIREVKDSVGDIETTIAKLENKSLPNQS